MNVNIQKNLKKKLPAHKDERGKRERIAIKVLIGFFIIMLVLTMLSRLADSITIPKVTTAQAKGGRLEYEIEGMGSLKAQNQVSIEAKEGFTIKDIFAKEGDTVAKGDQLLQLDLEELEKGLEEEQVALKKMQLQKQQAALDGDSGSLDEMVADAQLAVLRLEEDKKVLIAQEEVKIQRAEAEIEKAEQTLLEKEEAFEAFKGSNVDEQIKKAKEKAEEAKKSLEDQKYEQEKALKRAKNAVDEAENAFWSVAGQGVDVTNALQVLERAEMEYEITKKDWERKVKEAEDDLKKAKDTLSKLENGETDEEALSAEKDKVELAKEAVKNKQSALEDAKYNKEQVVAKIERDIVDAQRKILEAEEDKDKGEVKQQVEEEKKNITEQLLQLDIDLKIKQIDRLQQIKATGGKVIAPVAGVVGEVKVVKGDKSKSGDMITLISDETQYVFEAEVSKEDAEKIEVGDQVSITLQGEKTPIDEETVIEHITRIKEDEADKVGETDRYKVSVNIVEGEQGMSGEMVIKKDSKQYQALIPIEALREDNKGKYVLVAREQVTTLGTQQVAQRVDVTEYEKNGKMVSVQGAVNPQDQIITQGNKPIMAGDRVRLKKQ